MDTQTIRELLITMRNNGEFIGHQEHNADFENMDEKELYYYTEWLNTDTDEKGSI